MASSNHARSKLTKEQGKGEDTPNTPDLLLTLPSFRRPEQRTPPPKDSHRHAFRRRHPKLARIDPRLESPASSIYLVWYSLVCVSNTDLPRALSSQLHNIDQEIPFPLQELRLVQLLLLLLLLQW